MEQSSQNNTAQNLENTTLANVFYPQLEDITPHGKLTNNVDFKAKVQFKYGCFGFETETSFIPLMEWMDIESGEYVSNCGNKKIYTEKYPFWVES